MFDQGTWEILSTPVMVIIHEAVCKRIVMVDGKSDGLIVPGGRVMSAEGRGLQQASVVTRRERQSPNCPTHSAKVAMLISRVKQIRTEPHRTLAHLIDNEWLLESWKRLRKGASHGIDAVSAREYASNLEDNLEQLHRRLKAGDYNPSPVRRVYIPKPDGGECPLGLLTVEDKVAQNAVNYVLLTIYEQEFLPMSYGFRPGKNAHQVVEGVKAVIAQGKVSWVLDADIQSFFDDMSHEWLMKFMKHRLADRRILSLIEKWLNAGVMEEGKVTKASSGSPQGGVISPLLANIYLHYTLDLWITKVVKKQIEGEMYSFRYADDILFCFQFRRDAIKFQKMLKERLGKFSLRLNEEKTKFCRFGRYARRDYVLYKEKRAMFNFLGFTFYNEISRQGKYKVGCRTESRRLRVAINKVTEGNFRSIAAYYRNIVKIWQRYLSKRSQRAKLSWDKYMKILNRYPLTKAYLSHSIYAIQEYSAC